MVAQSEAFPAATASHSWTCKGVMVCRPVLAPKNSGSAQHAPGSSSTSAASASLPCSDAENSPAAAILASRRYSGRRRMRPAYDPRVLATASCLATSSASAAAASSLVSVGSAGCPLPSRPNVCSTRRLGLSRAAAEAPPCSSVTMTRAASGCCSWISRCCRSVSSSAAPSLPGCSSRSGMPASCEDCAMDRRLADRKLDALSAGCALFRPSQSCSAAILRVERSEPGPNSFLGG